MCLFFLSFLFYIYTQIHTIHSYTHSTFQLQKGRKKNIMSIVCNNLWLCACFHLKATNKQHFTLPSCEKKSVAIFNGLFFYFEFVFVCVYVCKRVSSNHKIKIIAFTFCSALLFCYLSFARFSSSFIYLFVCLKSFYPFFFYAMHYGKLTWHLRHCLAPNNMCRILLKCFVLHFCETFTLQS